MKKTIAFLTSLAALCSLISCEENEIENIKGDSEIIQEETVPTETPTEADLPFREYKAEDFTDIKVKLTMQQTAPPVKVEEYDLSWIEFEPKIPLCALPENRSIEKFMPYYESDAENYDMTPEEYAEEYRHKIWTVETLNGVTEYGRHLVEVIGTTYHNYDIAHLQA